MPEELPDFVIHLAEMPDDVLEILEKTDSLKAVIVRDARKLVEEYNQRAACEFSPSFSTRVNVPEAATLAGKTI